MSTKTYVRKLQREPKVVHFTGIDDVADVIALLIEHYGTNLRTVTVDVALGKNNPVIKPGYDTFATREDIPLTGDIPINRVVVLENDALSVYSLSSFNRLFREVRERPYATDETL